MTKARQLADLGNAYDDGALSNRNMIINGAMQVAQRGTSATGIGATGTAYHTLDRWQIETGNSGGRFTMSQSSDAPSGFGSSLKLDCTTAVTSIGAGEYLLLEYHLEGQDVQRIKTGTSDAEEVTISFYVKANASFNFVLEVLDSANGRQCSKLFSTTTGWNRVELTYPADPIGKIPNNIGQGIRLFFWMHSGSDYTSGTLNSSSFTTTALAASRASGISSFYSSTSNEFYLTGFQMEVGDTATPFEHRSYGDELAKCQRYYQHTYSTGSAVGTASHDNMIGSGGTQSYSTAGEVSGGTYTFKVEMRAVPSVTFYDHQGNSARCSRLNAGVAWYGNSNVGTSISTTTSSVKPLSPNGTTATGMYCHIVADAEL